MWRMTKSTNEEFRAGGLYSVQLNPNGTALFKEMGNARNIQTSLVQSLEFGTGNLRVTTRNSVYEFEAYL